MKDICSYLCAGALAPLEDNRSVSTVKCPLDGSVFAKSGYSGQVCETCQLTKLGEDTMGYSILVQGAGEEEKTGSAEDPLGLNF